MKSSKNKKHRILCLILASTFILSSCLFFVLSPEYFDFEYEREAYLQMIEEAEKSLFVNGLTVVTETTKYEPDGYVISSGKYSQKCKYYNEDWNAEFYSVFDEAYPFYSFDLAVVGVEYNGKMLYGMINRQGKYAVEPQYDHTQRYFDYKGMMPVKSADGGWGYINTEGEWVIQPKYTSAEPFNEFEIAYVSSNEYDALINRKGEEICILNDYTVVSSCTEGYYVVYNKNTLLYGFMNGRTGEIAVDCKFVNANPFVNGFAVVYADYGLASWIDKCGKLITDDFYSNATDFNEFGLATAYRDSKDKRCIINQKGEAVLESTSNLKVESYIGGNMYSATSSSGYCIIDPEGKILIDSFSVLNVPPFSEGITSLNRHDEYCFINEKAEIVFTLSKDKCKSPGSFNNSYIPVRAYDADGVSHYVFYDRNGNMVFEGNYSEISNLTADGYIIVTSRNKKGVYIQSVLDKYGEVVFAPERADLYFSNPISGPNRYD